MAETQLEPTEVFSAASPAQIWLGRLFTCLMIAGCIALLALPSVELETGPRQIIGGVAIILAVILLLTFRLSYRLTLADGWLTLNDLPSPTRLDLSTVTEVFTTSVVGLGQPALAVVTSAEQLVFIPVADTTTLKRLIHRIAPIEQFPLQTDTPGTLVNRLIGQTVRYECQEHRRRPGNDSQPATGWRNGIGRFWFVGKAPAAKGGR